MYLPSGQNRHVPALEAYLPAVHVVHDLLPVKATVPVAHVLHDVHIVLQLQVQHVKCVVLIHILQQQAQHHVLLVIKALLLYLVVNHVLHV